MILIICFIVFITSIILSALCLINNNKNNFSQILNYELCEGNGWKGFFHSKKHCINQMLKLSNNLNYQGLGQPANRGIKNTGEADAGSFGNPELL